MSGVNLYQFRWKNNDHRINMYGRTCRIISRGTMNSALIEFTDDGQREVISRNALRRIDTPIYFDPDQGELDLTG